MIILLILLVIVNTYVLIKMLSRQIKPQAGEWFMLLLSSMITVVGFMKYLIK